MIICIECGNDEACEGQYYCSDCLEDLGQLADMPTPPQFLPQPVDGA